MPTVSACRGPHHATTCVRQQPPLPTEIEVAPPQFREPHDIAGVALSLLITIVGSGATADIDGTTAEIRIAWSTGAKDSVAATESDGAPDGAHNEGLVQSVVRAHALVQSLRNGMYESIEMLAEANCLHPKVVRQALRLAFLSPDVTSVILEGGRPAALSLSQIPKLLPLQWIEHRRLIQ